MHETRNILEPNISNSEDWYVPNIMHMYLVSVITKRKDYQKITNEDKGSF